MAIRPRRIALPPRVKPVDLIEIDRSHPLCPRLGFYFTERAGPGREVITGVRNLAQNDAIWIAGGIQAYNGKGIQSAVPIHPLMFGGPFAFVHIVHWPSWMTWTQSGTHWISGWGYNNNNDAFDATFNYFPADERIKCNFRCKLNTAFGVDHVFNSSPGQLLPGDIAIMSIQCTPGDYPTAVFAGAAGAETIVVTDKGVYNQTTPSSINLYLGSANGNNGTQMPLMAFLVYDRPLTEGEALELYHDPYAPIRRRRVMVVVPSGLTTVSDSSTYTWNVQQRVTDTLIARWDQLQVLSDAAALLWDVRQIASDTVSAIWNDKQLTSDSLTFVWSLAGQVANSLVVKYDLLQSAPDTATARWNLRQSIADTIVAVWHERGLVSDQLTAPWNVYVTVQDVLSALWNDLSSLTVSDSLTLVWNAAGTVADALTGQWNVLQKTSFWETIRWDVYQQLSGAVTAHWSDFANASRSLAALWVVAGVVAKHLTPVWNDLERLGVSRSVLWDIAALLAKDITASWNVYALLSVGDVLTVKYDIIGKTNTSTTLRWNVYINSLPTNKIIKVVSRDTTVKISFRDTILKVT